MLNDMWSKIMTGAAALLAAALFASLGNRLIGAHGEARYQAGLAKGQVQQLPAILAAHAAATKEALDARDRIITADAAQAKEMARLTALIRRSDDEVNAYEATDAGHADCLGAGRVRAIEAARAALFPVTAQAPNGGVSGSLPADTPAQADGRGPE
jgi:hypothetical protein